MLMALARQAAACRRRCRGNGRRRSITARVSAASSPGTAASPRRHSEKAPWPGSTIWLAAAIVAGSAGDRDRAVDPGIAGRALDPPWPADVRLPDP
ncbi:MAG: hypothetical protein WDO24_29225 [Pseudomonadota bacterium]